MEKTLKLRTNEEAIRLYGHLDENLRFAEKEFGVRISARNNRLTLSGSKKEVEAAHRFFVTQLELLRGGRSQAAEEGAPSEEGRASEFLERSKGPVNFFHKGKIIKAKSKAQE